MWGKNEWRECVWASGNASVGVVLKCDILHIEEDEEIWGKILYRQLDEKNDIIVMSDFLSSFSSFALPLWAQSLCGNLVSCVQIHFRMFALFPFVMVRCNCWLHFIKSIYNYLFEVNMIEAFLRRCRWNNGFFENGKLQKRIKSTINNQVHKFSINTHSEIRANFEMEGNEKKIVAVVVIRLDGKKAEKTRSGESKKWPWYFS